MLGPIKSAIGDAVLTFMWVFCASLLGITTSFITASLGVQHLSFNGFNYANIIVTTVLVFTLVLVFTIVGDVLGGATFNPTGTAAFYAAGLGSDTLFSMALRFPAQVILTFISMFHFLFVAAVVVESYCTKYIYIGPISNSLVFNNIGLKLIFALKYAQKIIFVLKVIFGLNLARKFA